MFSVAPEATEGSSVIPAGIGNGSSSGAGRSRQRHLATMSLLSLVVFVIKIYLVAARVLLDQLFFRLSLRSVSNPKPVFPLQNGNVAIVTGGANGIGYHTVKALARLGMHVIIAGIDESKGRESVMEIRKEILNAKVEFLYCDLASVKSVYQFVKEFKAKNCPLHVLINNAGVMLMPKQKTEDGFEKHFAVNYLGHFLLTILLLNTLKQSGTHSHNARIISLSSATHYKGEINFNDLQSRTEYLPHRAYAQSKLALVLFSYRLQHLLTLKGSHVTVNVVDPGVVNTDLYQNVCWAMKVTKWLTHWIFFKTPEEGASTSIYAAVSPELEGVGGCYLYNDQRTKSADVSYDEEVQKRLWTKSCRLVGIPDIVP